MPESTKTSKGGLVATIFPAGQPNYMGAQTAVLKVIPPTDIVMFVPGTTDPINVEGLNHQANKDYWRDVKESQENFWKGVLNLNPPDNRQFHDLHIEETFFSWSGDNNHDKRVEAAERLVDLFKRVYPKFKNKTTHLHLIGHSHGGNVINEFTNTIVDHPDFPKKWKIKSITYLSTPFFQKQHQLNHTKLHSKCKIINVHNDYDLTQRVIADFTLKNLEILIQNSNSEGIKEAKSKITEKNEEVEEEGETVKKSNSDRIMDILFVRGILEREQLLDLWQRTPILLDGVQQYLAEWIKNINSLEGKTTILQAQKQEIILHITNIRNWAIERKEFFESRMQEITTWVDTPLPPIDITDITRSTARRIAEANRFSRGVYINDINLQGLLPTLNTILDIPERFATRDFFGAYLIDMLASIVMADASGISDIIDDTVTTPKEQVKGAFEIVDLPITDKDEYHTRSTKDNYQGFVQPIEMCVRAKRPDTLQEVLVRLVSQEVPTNYLRHFINFSDWVIELAVTDDNNDEQLDILQENLETYLAVIERFQVDLITEEDQEDDELEDKPGSLAYFAMMSHSLSHTKLWDEVKEALTSSFSSGKNPGYKPEKK